MRAQSFRGQRVAVFGLGTSGNATAKALMVGGAEVACWDDGEAGRVGAEKAGVPLVDLQAVDWSMFDALILSPGVPLTHPEPHWTVKKAQAAGIPVIGDVELFFRERALVAPECPVVAITGTNGKSTTTALIAHILAKLGLDVQLGGNIGRAVLTLDDPAPGKVYVLELSSFQIDLTPSIKPTVGVMLNLTPDHIDRHGTVENYAAVKERLVQASTRVAAALDDAYTQAMAGRFAAKDKLYPVTTGTPTGTERLIADGATIRDASGPIVSLDGVRSLRGAHNMQNALAALSAVLALENETEGRLNLWRKDALSSAVRSFPGLPHRLEEVASKGSILFINDSKATNADSTEKALASWREGIFWILGGKPKEGGITTLERYFPRIAKAYLIGEAATEFAATLEGRVPFEHAGTIDVALASALRDAETSGTRFAEPVVLLSPACASYDQFKSFEHRGDTFRTLVLSLPGLSRNGG